MARKRLSLSSPFGTDPLDPPLETKSASFGPPIARVAGDAAASAALADMTEAWAEARDGGRLVQLLPLEAVHENWLVRDRISLDNEEMADLVESIRARGQQVPIEVMALEDGRFGLISGWRRLRALKVLREGHEGQRFAQVQALLRRPKTPADAYRAMVEENEIRANLSYFERARIALRAAEAGVFPDARAAVAALFVAGSRAKRSKIGSFLTLVEALDDRLRFAAEIPERLGLALAKALESDPSLRERLRERLRKSAPTTVEAEQALLARALTARPLQDTPEPRTPPRAPARPARPGPGPTFREEVRPGLWLEAGGEEDNPRLILSGKGVDADLHARLAAWLREID